MVYIELQAAGHRTDVQVAAAVGARGCDLAGVVDPRSRSGPEAAGEFRVLVDGACLPAGEPIRPHLRRGSAVVVLGPNEPEPASEVALLACEAGWSTGARARLAPGDWYLSATAGSDWRATPPLDGGFLACTVAPDGSCTFRAEDDRTLWFDERATFGPVTLRAGDVFQFAGSEWRLRCPGPEPGAHLGPPGERGGVPFNRPPRTVRERVTPVIRLPPPPEPYTGQARMSWAMLTVPLVMGAAFAWLFGPLMALFALLTPVLYTANWAEDRIRARRHCRRDAARYAQSLTTLVEEVRAAAEAEAAGRREESPALSQLLERARVADTRIWERRPAHHDFMRVGIGTTDVEWRPPIAGTAGAPAPDVDSGERLEDVPALLDLSAGRVAGIVGDRARRAAVARAVIVQLAVLHGPADVRVACLAGARPMADWEWLKWLPHTAIDGPSGRRLITHTTDGIDAVLSALIAGEHGGPRAGAPPLTLLVVDAPVLTATQAQLLRDLTAGGGPPVSTLVLADSMHALPGTCRAIVDAGIRARETPSLTRHAHATLHAVPAAEPRPTVLVAGASADAARRCARQLARLDDPEVRESGAALPAAVSFLDAAGRDRLEPEAITQRWRDGRHFDALPALLGARESGLLLVDLVTDGPHALLGGTTGSGKSELLRTLVVALALARPPDQVNFVLIDYKGGSAFDVCTRLPHVVGLVTDLDEHLGRRALTCLEAELRYRERQLREAGASDLGAYRAAGEPAGSLPRLVVVVDEFAALARELPDFMRSLVDIAQRGRSLGVHLVLATQRPAGVINDQIRANTNLRIALRVQSPADSTDILDAPDAAWIDRGRPGRGFVRFAPGDVVPFQCAYLSGTAHPDGGDPPVSVTPFVAAWEQPLPGRSSAGTGDGGVASDITAVVGAINAAAAGLSLPSTRAPWPPPLPATLALDVLDDCSGERAHNQRPQCPPGPAIGLIDDPDRQQQRPWLWQPGAGNLWTCGAPGSGASELLVTLAIAAARREPVDRLHIYAIDCGTRRLARLRDLPHTGAVVFGSERERLVRLAALLEDEADRRRAGSREPAILLLIDRYDELPGALDSPLDARALDRIAQIVRSGQELGIHVALSTQRPGGVPASVAAALTQRLAFRLPDRQDYVAFGLRPADVPELPLLRAVEATTGHLVQFARADLSSTLAPASPRAVRRIGGLHLRFGGSAARGVTRAWPRPVETLPASVLTAAVRTAAHIGDDAWELPIGIGSRRLMPAGFRLREGDHALVVGPARSGRTTTLRTIAEAAHAADPSLAISAITPRRSQLAECREVTMRIATASPAAIAEAMRATCRRHLVLIDDADRVEDTTGELERALREERPDLRVVAAARSDVLRGAYAHWTRPLRQGRQALLLRPDPDADGELFSIVLPRDRTQLLPGRGYLLVEGELELVQCAQPEVDER